MSLISYAQNFEDVMLWRALQHINNGFYIDIGAQDPVIDSVSLAFYEHGWRGVHVEPTSYYANKIKTARPDEVVEQVAIGDTEGKLVFHEFTETGLSTADAAIAANHVEAGYRVVRTEVTAITLTTLLERYKDKAIHWLKIDVEGMEERVLRNWKASSGRPWILVVESTRPSTQEESHSDWEQHVFEKGYVFAYFDGLNRFYVHSDHLYLLEYFKAPPNIFDGFILSGSASQPFYKLVQERAQMAEHLAQQAETKAQQFAAEAQDANARFKELADQLAAVYLSSSWRLTRPLRWLRRAGEGPRTSFVRAVRQLSSSSKATCRSCFGWALRAVSSQPRLKAFLVRVLASTPSLNARVRALARQVAKGHVTVREYEVSEQAKAAPASARKVFADLQRALDQTSK